MVIQEGGEEFVYWSDRTQPNLNNKVIYLRLERFCFALFQEDNESLT